MGTKHQSKRHYVLVTYLNAETNVFPDTTLEIVYDNKKFKPAAMVLNKMIMSTKQCLSSVRYKRHSPGGAVNRDSKPLRIPDFISSRLL